MRNYIASIASLVLLVLAQPAVLLMSGNSNKVKAEISSQPSAITWGVDGIQSSNSTGTILSQVWAIEEVGNRIYVGGKFTNVSKTFGTETYARNSLAAFDINSGEWIPSFAPDIEGPVYALEASADGSRLYVGGEFESVNGQANTAGLVALNPTTGAVDSSFNPGLGDWAASRRTTVQALHINNGQIYAGGFYSRANIGRSEVRNLSGVARFSLSDGTVDPNWTPSVEGGTTWGISSLDNGSRVYVVGTFASVNNDANSKYMAVLNGTNAQQVPGLTSYVSQSNYPNRGYLQDVEVVANKVWVGGSEHAIIQMDSATNNVLRHHSTDRGGDYQDIEVVGDRVYASCHCYTNHFADYDGYLGLITGTPVPAGVEVTPIKYVAAYNAISGDYINSFLLDASATRAGVWALHGDKNGCLWAGGDLSRGGSVANGQSRTLKGFARFCEEDFAQPVPAPTGLRVTRTEKKLVVLNYGAVAEAASYKIYRNGTFVATDPDTWNVQSGLSEGTTYTFEVTAVNAAGTESAKSNAVTVTTLGGAPPVGNTVPAPTGLRVTRTEKKLVVLNYGAVAEAASYKIYRNGTFVATDPDTWNVQSGLSEGTTYTFEVTAVNAAGTESAKSNAVTVTTLGGAPPVGNTVPAPTGLRTTNQTRERIVLNHARVNGAASYKIYRNGVFVGSETSTWYTDLGLSAGTSYSYTVSTVDANGTESPQSAAITASTKP